MLPPKMLARSYSLLSNSDPYILPSSVVTRTALICGSTNPVDCVIGVSLATESWAESISKRLR